MSERQRGPGTREVAFRVFAAEYDDADLSYSESDEERAPNYVLTPTGARINRLFVVGVLTEVERVNEEMLRARVVDPTGAFVVYAGQYQPEVLGFLDRVEPPLFVAVTGKARTFEPDDGNRVYTSVRPESMNEVDDETRDRWSVGTADQTLDRVATMAAALEMELGETDLETALLERGVRPELAAGVPRALEHYGTTPSYLAAVRDMAVEVLEFVAGDRDGVSTLEVAPDTPGEVSATELVDAAAAARIHAEPVATDPDAEQATGSPDPASPEASANDVTRDDASVGRRGESDTTVDDTVAGDTADAPDVETAGPTAGDAAADPTEGIGDAVSDDPPDVDAVGAPDPTTDTVDDTTFELDETERQELEEEYGTDFASGTEVDEPGEAGIDPETPDSTPRSAGTSDDEDHPSPEESRSPSAPDEGEPAAGDDASGVTGRADDGAPDGIADESADQGSGDAESGAADVDLEAAVVASMRDLDDGDGVDRQSVVSAVAEEHGVETGTVEDALQEALMSGKCYEPDEGRLKAI